MSFAKLQTRHYSIEILTEHYYFTAALEPPGMLLNYLNHPDRTTFLFKQAAASALDAGSKLPAFQADELWLRRDEIVAFHFVDMLSSGTMPLLPRKEKLRVFVTRFVVQAVFRCGADTALGDIFDSMNSYWAPATEARVHPLLPCACPVFSEAALLLVNRRHIRFYQPIKEG
jgi:hypothetical protein